MTPLPYRASLLVTMILLLPFAGAGCGSSSEESEQSSPSQTESKVPPEETASAPDAVVQPGETASAPDVVGPDLELYTPIALLVLGVCLLLALGTVFFLLRWRRIERSGQLSLAPVELLDRLAEQDRSLSRFVKVVSQHLTESGNVAEKAHRSGDDLLGAFSSLQTALDEKDTEIRRLRAGYDAEVFRRFLTRFLRVHRALAEEVEDSTSDESRNQLLGVQAVLLDALEECGVESFVPDLGESVRSAFGVDDNYSTVRTSIQEQDLKIAGVLEPGMRIRTPDGGECVSPARVSVYVYSVEEERGTSGQHNRD